MPTLKLNCLSPVGVREMGPVPHCPLEKYLDKAGTA